MGKLKHDFFSSASAVCNFVNKHDVNLKSVAIRVIPAVDVNDKTEITYVAFYEEKENG